MLTQDHSDLTNVQLMDKHIEENYPGVELFEMFNVEMDQQFDQHTRLPKQFQYPPKLKLIKVKHKKQFKIYLVNAERPLPKEEIWRRIFNYQMFYKKEEAEVERRVKELIKQGNTEEEAEIIAANEQEGI